MPPPQPQSINKFKQFDNLLNGTIRFKDVDVEFGMAPFDCHWVRWLAIAFERI